MKQKTKDELRTLNAFFLLYKKQYDKQVGKLLEFVDSVNLDNMKEKDILKYEFLKEDLKFIEFIYKDMETKILTLKTKLN